MTSEMTTVVDELVIGDVETMKVVADERRLKILTAMRQPTTVKAIAAEIGMSPSKLYYHVNMLEKHGLIQVVDVNIESGIVEKQYQVTAHQFKIRNPMLMGEALPTETAVAIFNPLFDDTKAAFAQALQARDPQEPTPPRHPFASKKAFRLTDAQLTTFHAKLDALIQETDALAAANDDLDGAPFELLVAFYKQQVT